MARRTGGWLRLVVDELRRSHGDVGKRLQTCARGRTTSCPAPLQPLHPLLAADSHHLVGGDREVLRPFAPDHGTGTQDRAQGRAHGGLRCRFPAGLLHLHLVPGRPRDSSVVVPRSMGRGLYLRGHLGVALQGALSPPGIPIGERRIRAAGVTRRPPLFRYGVTEVTPAWRFLTRKMDTREKGYIGQKPLIRCLTFG